MENLSKSALRNAAQTALILAATVWTTSCIPTDPFDNVGTGGARGSGGQQGSGGSVGSGGQQGSGGSASSGGQQGSGGSASSGGQQGSGGSVSSGGQQGSGGSASSGGQQGSGGSVGSGGQVGSGGNGSGTGGAAMPGSGGRTGGSSGAGGRLGTGGSSSTPDGGTPDGSGAGTGGAAAGGTSGNVPAGYAVCVACHGVDGAGVVGRGPEIQHPVVDFATWVIRNGRTHPDFPDPMLKFAVDALPDTQLQGILSFLAARPKPTTGQTLFLDYCANCHGANAAGGVTMRPINSAPMTEFTTMVRGGHSAGQFAMRREYMPKWTATELTDAEIRLIFTYVDGL